MRWSLWRRSIQARVVITTVVLTAIAIGVVGAVLIARTRDSLVSNRVDAVVAEAQDEISIARGRLSAASGIDVDASAQRRDLVEPIIERGATRGFDVVMTGPGGDEFSPGLDIASVPAVLSQHFASPGASTAWTYTSIQADRASGGTTPGVVVGSQVSLPADGSTYTLYFLFPLSQEQQTLQLVISGLGVAGLLLVVLVALVVWLVARQVVTPIRLARQVAERLAAGQLQERMRVTGRDDLGRLAVSFNQMASNLQNQIRQLEELSRVQRRFTSDVSHELRTPLTTVRMASDVLHDARDQLDPVAGRAAELLQTELDRFETLLVDLLEISRFDAGAAELQVDDVDLAQVVRRVVSATAPLAAQAGVRLVVDAPEPAYAEADVRRLERIVRNLVGNAIDHAGERAEVVVRAAGDEHAAAIAVRDYGVGLAPGETAMVFNRFWRADPARARSSGGTGLGLSISLEDAHLHGGWLQAWGRRGGGAQFRLTLPRHSGDQLRHSPIPLVPADAEKVVT